MKKVKDLTILEVIKMPLFFNAIGKKIDDLILSHDSAERDALTRGGKLAQHPIDFLRKMGYMSTGNFIVEYSNILNKKSELSSAQRGFILSIGNQIFTDTVIKLIENEKNKNKRGGNN